MSNNNCKLCTPQKLEDVNTVMFTKEKKWYAVYVWVWPSSGTNCMGVSMWKPNDAENVFIWKQILIYDKDGKKDGKWRTTVVL